MVLSILEQSSDLGFLESMKLNQPFHSRPFFQVPEQSQDFVGSQFSNDLMILGSSSKRCQLLSELDQNWGRLALGSQAISISLGS